MAIREHTEGAVTIAYAVRWSEVFREWQFVGMRNTYDDDDDTTIRSAISTCIEGIRVEFTTPGFEKIGLAAIANATGRAAPKTNVARSSFESTPELAAMLRSIYRCYTRHIRNEFSALHERRSFSLTWATGEVLFMVKQFLESNRASDAVAWPILKGEIEKLPTVLVEHRGERRALSPVEIASEPSFWTSESALLKSAERLIKEVPGSASLSALFASFGAPGLGLPDGMILSADPSDVLPITVFERREVERIEVIRRERRVDLLWRHTHNPAAWRGIPPQLLRAARRTLEAPAARRFFREFHIEDVGNMRIGASPILLSGLAGEAAILSRNFLFVVHGTEICSYLNNWIDRLQSATRKLDAICAVIEFSIAYSLFKGSLEPPVNEVDLRKLISDAYPSAVTRSDVRALVDLINRNSWQCFDPSAWDRPED
jgi:hypothetical protein